MQVTLEVANSEAAARIVKARLERTTLGQVAQRIRATLRPVSSMAVRAPCPKLSLSSHVAYAEASARPEPCCYIPAAEYAERMRHIVHQSYVP